MDQQPIQPTSTPGNSSEVEEAKILSVIGYLGILCIIPLLLKPQNKFAKFHGTQGLVLLIAWIVVNVVSIIPVLGWLIAMFGNLACLILMIIGMTTAFHGETKELPVIGQYAKKINL